MGMSGTRLRPFQHSRDIGSRIMIRLHGYYRSSTSYRLRIALELKGLDYEYVPVNLLESEQKGAAFTSRNPFGSVPLLEVDGKDYVQSMAQLEWLDEAFADRPLL